MAVHIRYPSTAHRPMLFRRIGAVLSAGIMLTSCATSSGPDLGKLPSTLASPVVSSETKRLSPQQMAQVLGGRANAAYELGANDVIAVSVYSHPELSVPLQGVGGGASGALITSDGTVQLPLIGSVDIGGKTLIQAKDIITAAYSNYIDDPSVAVELVQAQSLRYYLLGAFTDPGVKYPAHSLALLDALALGGSVDLSKADLYQAYVAQGPVKLPVDLHALLVDGDLSQNIPLTPGDAIVVPSAASESVYIMGAVTKPGPVSFNNGSLSLLQALSESGFDLTSYSQARLSHIHVLRTHGASAQFIVVDAQATLNGKAAMFTLEPGDVVFVPPTAIATWNQILEMALPSLQTISSVISPFVQITYLSRRN
jgi:polysaccharide export outer membrane protein